MAQLTIQTIATTGLAPTYAAAAAGGDAFLNDGATYFHVKNGSGASINVTVNSVTACDQGFDHDQVVAVPAAGERILGPFPSQRWNDASSNVNMSYSAVTSVTVAAVKLPVSR